MIKVCVCSKKCVLEQESSWFILNGFDVHWMHCIDGWMDFIFIWLGHKYFNKSKISFSLGITTWYVFFGADRNVWS